MPDNNNLNNEELEKQKERFLKELEMKEKMLDAQLNRPNNSSNEQVHLSYKPTLAPNTKNNTDNSIEAQKKRFLEDLDKKEKELNQTIAYENSLSGSNLTRRKKEQSSQQLMKFKFYRTIIGAVVLIVVIILIFKSLMAVSYDNNMSSTTDINVTQVKIALMNYYDDYNKLPIDNNSRINIDELLKKQYLGTEVEKICDCKFYLKDDKQTVIAIPN